MSQNVHGTFVSEKISKIRWRPDQFENSHSFVTGSWDNDENTIKLWKLVTTDEDDIYPCELKSYRANGDVTEIKFINQDLLVASTSDGSVNLLRVTDRENEAVDIKEQVNWKQIHKFKNSDPTSCTGLSTYDEDIVTIGEDGRINLLTSRRETLVRSIENADSCSLHCVSFLTYHPTQRHMVLAGDEEGSLTVWDLRLNTFPVTLLSAHSSAVSEMQFHPNNPEHLFSCSNNGEIWHWSTVNQSKHRLITVDTDQTNPWFSNETLQLIHQNSYISH